MFIDCIYISNSEKIYVYTHTYIEIDRYAITIVKKRQCI